MRNNIQITLKSILLAILLGVIGVFVYLGFWAMYSVVDAIFFEPYRVMQAVNDLSKEDLQKIKTFNDIAGRCKELTGEEGWLIELETDSSTVGKFACINSPDYQLGEFK